MSATQQEPLLALNPADYLTLTMDQEIRQDNMPGSICGYALELDQLPDIDALSERITEFGARFPVAYASLQQRGKRFFWFEREQQHALFVQHHAASNSDEAGFHHATIIELLNHKEARETLPPISFHLLQSANKTTLLLRWIHPFCDAKGTGLILQYLCTDSAEKRLNFDLPTLQPLVNQQLAKYKWWQKISFFFKAKCYITQLDKLQSIIHADTTKSPEKLNFNTYTLTPEQTQVVNKLARQYVGITGTSLYYIGCLMRALHKMNPEQAGDAYCTPYAFNLRKNKALSPLLGNHVGALFAQAPKSILHDRNALFQHLKQQHVNVIREKLDYAFLPVMWAASWLSLQRHGQELRKSYGSGTERSSFWFSDIGHVDLSKEPLLGSNITRVLHLCQITSPPALALLSCQLNNQLTLSYNFIEPLFTPQWIEQLHELVVAELLTA
ncbi:MAG: hypothetical protein methR_P1629 [Methyloprofundus sp.]|nr:MAG: hypothetical protein methR_P1629 [Methyloprofundus sp.]